MIDQHREMTVPGQGIVRDRGPIAEHNEFPKHMAHPGFRPGKADQEIKVIDGNGRPTGQLIYAGSEAIRFPPVLVHDAMQQEYHESQGYAVIGKSDPASFARLVADAQPVPETYKPLEYPKYVFGKIVQSAEEAEAWMIEMKVNPDGSPRVASSEAAGEPALDVDVNTLADAIGVADALAADPAGDDDDIEALEAKLAALKAKRAAPMVTLNEAAVTEPLVMKEPITEVTTTARAKRAAPKRKQPADPAKSKARSDAIKAGLNRRKAERLQTVGEA